MPQATITEYLRQHIRTVPDWPAPGVQFRDITPLLQDPEVFRVMVDAFVQRADQLAAKFGPGFVLSDEVKAAIKKHQPVY